MPKDLLLVPLPSDLAVGGVDAAPLRPANTQICLDPPAGAGRQRRDTAAKETAAGRRQRLSRFSLDRLALIGAADPHTAWRQLLRLDPSEAGGHTGTADAAV